MPKEHAAVYAQMGTWICFKNRELKALQLVVGIYAVGGENAD
jgi:hypothetical protein